MAEMQSSFMDPEKTIQIELDVQPLFGRPNRLVWLQFLLDSKLKEKRFLMLNLYEIPEEIEQGQKMTKREISRATKVMSRNFRLSHKFWPNILSSFLRLTQVYHIKKVM